MSLVRLRSISWRDRALLVESLVALCLASLIIALLPFRSAVRATAWFGRSALPAEPERDAARRRVRWAILAVSARLPWRVRCFQRGLAAHWMLRRRGLPAELHYGAATRSGGAVHAHVWVRDGGISVVGGEESPGFTGLAVFPRDRGHL
jgi:Transglutaminase-like superfamily